MTPRWEVQIIVPDTGKAKVWDAYADRDRAESIAATLRYHGFFVQVRRLDDDAQVEAAP